MQKDIRKLDRRLKFYFCKTEQKLCVIANFDEKNFNLYDKYTEMLEMLLKQKESEWSCSLKATVGNVHKGLEGIGKSYDEAGHLMSLYEMNQYFDKEEKNVIASSNENLSGHTNKKTVNQIVTYIKSNFQEKDICLDIIAKNVHLSPAYVSAMFKKEKNINISDYIIKIRIERAKYLLMTTDMKTYEISEEIGYVNSQYFSVLFKRNTGASPTEYRQRASVNVI